MEMLLRWSTYMTLIFVFPMTSHAQENKLTLVNHYDKPLTVTVGINPNTVPELPQTFTLQPNSQISTQVVIQGKEAYMRAEDVNGNFGFFGVEFKNQLKIHGYLSRGLAFSWQAGTVTFCSPEVYRQHKSC